MDKKQISTYQDAEEYILNIPKFTKKNSLELTRNFYEYLGKPGNKRKVIHVAGTNGKGSVCAYLNTLLEEAGFSVGMFTSPHLITILERFQINGVMMEEQEFLTLFFQVENKRKEWNNLKNQSYHPTFFEWLFFMGMLFFEIRKVDYIVLETGLGGRLDATNVIEHKEVAVITKIGLDHTEYLGDTLDKIALEKAGIIENEVPVVYFNSNEEVSRVIEKKAWEKEKSPVFSVTTDNIKNYENHNKSIDFSYDSKYYGYSRLSLSSCGLYQVINASLALKAIEVIGVCEYLTLEQVKNAIFNTTWSGRMEEVLPDVFLDGAHNEDGITALVQAIENMEPKKNHLLFAVVNDKDYSKMVAVLMKKNLFSNIIITKVQSDRAMDPNKLAEIFKQHTANSIMIYEDGKEALTYCVKHKGEDRLFIAGSLYLAGMVKQSLNDR